MSQPGACPCCVTFQLVSCHVFCECRHLEIGRESHKLIDAKVKQAGLDIVSEPFEFGMHLPCIALKPPGVYISGRK